MAFLTVAIVFVAGATYPATKIVADNMNGEYRLSKTAGAPAGGYFPTNFKNYPGGVESFDAYHGPINTTYSQVWWTSSTDSIPPDIVKRFDGKVMAIVGIEMDQVRRTPEDDVSVPISLAYNHHHNTFILGKGSNMEILNRDDPVVAGVSQAGNFALMSDPNKVWRPTEHTPSKTGSNV